MGKILIIGAIVLVVWAGLEIQTYGVEGAFNGLFAPAGMEEAEAITSTPQTSGRPRQESLPRGRRTQQPTARRALPVARTQLNRANRIPNWGFAKPSRNVGFPAK